MTEQGTPLTSVFYRRDGLDPGPELRDAQREEPVRRVQDFWLYTTGEYWLVTRYADVRRVLADSETFAMHDPARSQILPPELLNADAPEHTRLRHVLAPEFTVKRVRGLEPMITAAVDGLLDVMESTGAPADLMSAFALPLPAMVMCDLLGVPVEDREDFQRRARISLDLSLPMEQRLAANRQSHDYMAVLVEGKRREPDERLIGRLIREHDDAVSDDELVGVADILLLAGHETVSNMLGLATLALLTRPEQAARLRDAAPDDPVIGTAVEELLRHLAVSSTALARTARRDTEIAGVAVKAGDQVVCQLPVANRDPALGVGMDHLDIGREPVSHLTFGHGAHRCLGASLAQAELRVALPALLRRFPRLALTGSPEDLSYRHNHEVYGLYSLPVTW
ncbi:cytochrome P450 [Streptomyces sp. NPDC093249]|uniref:cytochrome P450 n=1 Tax=unclassified Streptomyces TaxID=2593676 RepID=UPI0038254679